MRRFFVEPENISGSTAILVGTEARHVSTVLRLRPDTAITLFDGSGSFYEARIVKITPVRVVTRITAITPFIEAAEDRQPALHLAVGLIKNTKMDFIIQKSTELGIESLHPFRSEFCAVSEADGARISRWRKIARESCKQCNRPKPPEIHEVRDYSSLISHGLIESYDLKIIFWEEERSITLRQILAASEAVRSALIVIGPEGGFKNEEVEAATAADFQAVSLGSRILRTETAVIAAAAILQHEFGNLG